MSAEHGQQRNIVADDKVILKNWFTAVVNEQGETVKINMRGIVKRVLPSGDYLVQINQGGTQVQLAKSELILVVFKEIYE